MGLAQITSAINFSVRITYTLKVTSVGATQVIPGANVVKDLATGVQPEEACETVIYSGVCLG